MGIEEKGAATPDGNHCDVKRPIFEAIFFEDGTRATSHHVSRIAVAKVELKYVRG